MEIKIKFDPTEKQPVEKIEPIMPPQATLSPKEAAKAVAEERSTSLAMVYQELEHLIGLHQVKNTIYEIQAFVEIQKRRQAAGLKGETVVLHAIFKGNPGTGKTTVARLMAKLLREMGLLEKGHLVEVERADLVGEYIGHTAKKTREKIEKAQGGVLFIDEAYSLARGGEKDFGKEAIDVLVKAMEDKRHQFVLILAGYKDEMAGFLRANPGLISRFPLHIEFPDYTLDELLEIAEFMYQERQYLLASDTKILLRRILSDALQKYPKHNGNARLVRNIMEASLRRQAVRLLSSGASAKDELMVITPFDVTVELDKMLSTPAEDPLDNCIPLLQEYSRHFRDNALSI